MTKEQVFIFYSSETEPEILDYYGEAISYLKELKDEVEIIDVYKNPKLAEQHKICATPTLIIKKGSKVREYFGFVVGVKELLRSHTAGKTFIHGMNYREGREFARKNKFDKNKNLKIIESVIGGKLSREKIMDFKINKFDAGKGIADVSLKFRKKSDERSFFNDISAFLGGIFMEIFDKTVFAKKAATKGKNVCRFMIQ